MSYAVGFHAKISYAGKGDGLAGSRSGLWFEFARIVRELRPRYVVVENVPALLTRGIEDVLGSLSSLRYDAVWSTVRASDVGAPHRRARIFIVAWDRTAFVGDPADGGIRRRCAQGGAGLPSRAGEGLADPAQQPGARLQQEAQEPGRSGDGVRFGEVESGLGRASHGVPGGLDRHWPAGPHLPQYAWEHGRTVPAGFNLGFRAARLRALGNAVVPACSRLIGELVVELERRRNA